MPRKKKRDEDEESPKSPPPGMSAEEALATVQRACAKGDWKTKFLMCLELVPNISLACQAAQVSRGHVYKARQSDPAFAEAWDDLLNARLDAIAASVLTRAAQFDTPIPDAIKVLERFRPEWRPPKAEVQHTGSVAVEVIDRHLAGIRKGFEASGLPESAWAVYLQEFQQPSLPAGDTLDAEFRVDDA